MRKRVFSLCMVLVMCLSLLPMPTLATGVNQITQAEEIAESTGIMENLEAGKNMTSLPELIGDGWFSDEASGDSDGFQNESVEGKGTDDFYTPEYIEALHAQFKDSDMGNAVLLGDVNSPNLRIRYASQILAKSNIVLAKAHQSGKTDNAFAYNNVLDTSNGKQASRSAYGTAPGGTVALDVGLLKILLDLEEHYGRIDVSEIAGGDHSAGSLHYKGLAMDITYVGSAVSLNMGKDIYQYLISKGYKLKPVITGTVYENQYHYHIALSEPTPESDNFVDVGTDFYAYIINTKIWKHLTYESDSEVVIKTETATPNQIWHFNRLEDGSYKITSRRDGKSLDLWGYNAEPGAELHLYEYHGGTNQRWYIYGSSGAYRFRAQCKVNPLVKTNFRQILSWIAGYGH